MSFHHLIKSFVVVCAFAILTPQVEAQIKLPPQREQDDLLRQMKETPVELTQEAGPWLIMCASFAGDEAEVQALKLVQELRNRYGLLAFTYRRHFDYTGSYNGLGFDPNDGNRLSNDRMIAKPLKMRALRNNEFDEIAVLVGNYPTIEDGPGQDTLHGIKYLMPESLGRLTFSSDENGESLIRPDQSDTQTMRASRAIYRTVNPSADKRKGAMGGAFMLANPLLPDEYFSAYKVDEFVLKMNRNRSIKHSLLDNKGFYTVRVATYRGDTTFELDRMQQNVQNQNWLMQKGKSIKESKLAVAMARAHRLTIELRKLGIAAYEFHDRHESYVCVGSYEWLKKQENGREIQNPEIVELIQAFKGRVENFPGVPGAVRAKTLSDIARAYNPQVKKVPNIAELGVVFDVQPIPVRVPQSENRARAARIQGGGTSR